MRFYLWKDNTLRAENFTKLLNSRVIVPEVVAFLAICGNIVIPFSETVRFQPVFVSDSADFVTGDTEDSAAFGLPVLGDISSPPFLSHLHYTKCVTQSQDIQAKWRQINIKNTVVIR